MEEIEKPLKSESESKPETEAGLKPKRRRRVLEEWELKRPEDLVVSDFWMYEDDHEPFAMGVGLFEYKNKAWIEREKKIKVTMTDYRERSRDLSIFDAIARPEFADICGGVTPLSIDDGCRLNLTPLCNAALDNYNDENQAQDPSNNNAITFQAQVQLPPVGPPKVYPCAIKI